MFLKFNQFTHMQKKKQVGLQGENIDLVTMATAINNHSLYIFWCGDLDLTITFDLLSPVPTKGSNHSLPSKTSCSAGGVRRRPGLCHPVSTDAGCSTSRGMYQNSFIFSGLFVPQLLQFTEDFRIILTSHLLSKLTYV